MIIVTGGAGFIGSNLALALKARGHDVLVVDNLKDGTKFKNLVQADIVDFWDKERFLAAIEADQEFDQPVEAVFHQGACSATTEWDGRYMMDNNYRYSRQLLDWCEKRRVPFIYASSAAVYGGNSTFVESPEYEAPLNVYGYSKLLFDQHVRRLKPGTQVVGFRYFNVYGPREQHKGSMSSVAYHLNGQVSDASEARLFAGCDGYPDGGQRRDFVHVDDVVATNLWFLDNPQASGIFNVGTGRSQTFKEVAEAVLNFHGKGEIRYIDFPEHLRGRYQSFTEADLRQLRGAGCDVSFRDVETGVADYLQWLNAAA